MADSVDKNIKKAARYSKGSEMAKSLFLGDNNTKKPLFNWTRDNKKLLDDTVKKLNKINLSKDSNSIVDSKILEVNESLENLKATLSTFTIKCGENSLLSAKQLKFINKTISKITLQANKFWKLYESGKLSLYLDNSNVPGLYKKSFEDINEELKKVQSLYEEIEKTENYSPENYTNTLSDMGLSRAKEQDELLVTAFAFIGIDIRRDGNKWKYEPIGPVPADKFVLKKDIVDAFVNNYLNKDVLERQGRLITPKGLFQFYIEQLEQEGVTLKKESKATYIDIITKAKEIYSIDSEDWKNFAMTDDKSVRRDATRSAIAGMFSDQFEDLHSLKLSDEINEQINTNDKVSSVLKNLFNGAKQEYEVAMQRVNDASHGFGSGKDYLENYRAEYARIKGQLDVTNDPEHQTVLQERLDNVIKASYTFRAVRHFQDMLIKKVLDEASQTKPNITPQEKIDKIKNLFKSYGDFDFVKVEKVDDKWEIKLDENFVTQDKTADPDSLESTILSVFDANKNEINEDLNKGTTQTQNSTTTPTTTQTVTPAQTTPPQKTNSSNLQVRFLDDNEILDLCNDENICQLLVDDAIYDRTEAIFGSEATNIFRDELNNYKQNNQPFDYKDFIIHLNNFLQDPVIQDSDDKIDNPLFTKESLERFFDPNKKKEEEEKSNKNYVRLARIANRINADPELIKAIDQNNTSVIESKLKTIYSDVEKGLGVNISPTEIEKAKRRFANLNKIKRHWDLEKMTDEDGKNFLEALRGSENSRKKGLYDILDSRYKEIEQDHADDLAKIQAENAQNGIVAEANDQDQQQDSEKEPKPYKFKDKYGKNDSSEILKKLKPYCKKTVTKILDELIKQIDNTTIKPKAKENNTNGMPSNNGTTTGTVAKPISGTPAPVPQATVVNNNLTQNQDESSAQDDDTLEQGTDDSATQGEQQGDNATPSQENDETTPVEETQEEQNENTAQEVVPTEEYLKLKQELEQKGKFALRIGGELLKQAYDPNKTDLLDCYRGNKEKPYAAKNVAIAIKFLAEATWFIGGVDEVNNMDEIRAKIDMLDLLNNLITVDKLANAEEKFNNVQNYLNSQSDPKFKQISTVMNSMEKEMIDRPNDSVKKETEPIKDYISAHLLLLLDLTSGKVKTQDGQEVITNIGGKISPETIEELNACKDEQELSEKLKKIITKEKIIAVLKEIVTTENVAVKSEESQENEAPKVEETPKAEENQQDEITFSTLDGEDPINLDILKNAKINPIAIKELSELKSGDTKTLKRIVNKYNLYNTEQVDALSRALGSGVSMLIEEWQKEAEKDQGMEQ